MYRFTHTHTHTHRYIYIYIYIYAVCCSKPCIHVLLYICISIYVCIYIYTYIQYENIQIRKHTNMYVQMKFVYINRRCVDYAVYKFMNVFQMWVSTWWVYVMYACTCIRTCTDVYIFYIIYVRMCVCIYIYIYIYISRETEGNKAPVRIYPVM